MFVDSAKLAEVCSQNPGLPVITVTMADDAYAKCQRRVARAYVGEFIAKDDIETALEGITFRGCALGEGVILGCDDIETSRKDLEGSLLGQFFLIDDPDWQRHYAQAAHLICEELPWKPAIIVQSE